MRTPDTFDQLYAAVTEGMWMDLPQEKEENNAQNAKARRKQTVTSKPDKKPPKVLQGNKYALLRDEESEDEPQDEL